MHPGSWLILSVTALVVPFARAASADAVAPSLGRAAGYVILAGSAVSNSGPTLVTGDVGFGSSISGLTPANFTSSVFAIRSNDRAAQQDNAAAYASLASQPLTIPPNAVPDVFPSGVYRLSPPVGTIKLQGKATDVWVFQIDGNLKTDADSSVVLEGGVSSNVFWRVGGSAELGARSTFVGSLLAVNDITVDFGVSLSGRLLTQKGAVTLATDDIVLCCDPLTLSPLDRGTITATGGTPPYTFRLFAGALPTGQVLSADGRITGTPPASGTFHFTVLATDSQGCSSIRTYDVTICPAITVLPNPLPPAPAACRYQQQLTASGGSRPYTFTSTPLPDGLVLSPEGSLHGIPTTSECREFTVTATDSAGCVGTATYNVCGLTILPEVLPSAVVDTPYNVKLTGGDQFTLCFNLPPGLSLFPDGTISGTPTQAGHYPFTVTAVLTTGTRIGSRSYAIDVFCRPAITLPDATVGTLYDQPVAGSDHSALPHQLGLTSGHLSGTPTEPENEFHFTVADPSGCRQEYIITIRCPPLALSMPDALMLGASYSYQFVVTGLTDTFTFSHSDSLPASLSLTSSGLLSGTVTSAAPYDFTVTAVGTTYTCLVSGEFKGQPACALSIGPDTLPNGSAGIPYSKMLGGLDGSGSYAFTPAAPLPWLSLSTDGLLSGVPPAAGTYTFTVTVTDTVTNCTASKTYTLLIDSFPPSANPTPTLSGWALLVLSSLLATIAIAVIRRTP